MTELKTLEKIYEDCLQENYRIRFNDLTNTYFLYYGKLNLEVHNWSKPELAEFIQKIVVDKVSILECKNIEFSFYLQREDKEKQIFASAVFCDFAEAFIKNAAIHLEAEVIVSLELEDGVIKVNLEIKPYKTLTRGVSFN